MNNQEASRNGLKQEFALQQSRLFNAVCNLSVLSGFVLSAEGVVNNGPADVLAGGAVVAIGAIVKFRANTQETS